MSQIFISYKREDRNRAKELATVLIARGYEVWWDVELLPGEDFYEDIARVIKNADAAIVLWSEKAIHSRPVRAEADLADRLGILLPARIDPVIPPLPFNSRHTIDLSDWQGNEDHPEFKALIQALVAKVGKPKRQQKPEKVVEAELEIAGETWKVLWTSVLNLNPPSISEYQNFLKKYETEADNEIIDFANRQIESLSKTSKSKKVKQLYGMVAGVIFLFAAILQITQGLKTELPKSVEPGDSKQERATTAKPIPKKSIDNNTVSISPYVFFATKANDGRLVLNGYVRNAAERERVLREANALFSGKVTNSIVKIATGAPNDSWGDVVSLNLSELKSLENGTLNMDDTLSVIRGRASDEATREKVNAVVGNLPAGYEGASNVSVPNAAAVNVGVVKSESICQTLFDELKGANKINFAYNKAEIRGAKSYDLLNTMASAAKQCAMSRIEVVSHTDSDGDDSYNQALSKARAKEVVSYLADNGVALSRLSAKGMGEANPIASNATHDGKAQNRRIEFIITQAN